MTSQCHGEELVHARPLLCVDRVLRLSAEEIVVEKDVRAEEPYFAGHYPKFKVYPGVFMVEAADQAGRTYALRFGQKAVPEEIRTRFLAPVVPGDTLRCESRCSELDGGARLRVDTNCFKGEARVAYVKIIYSRGTASRGENAESPRSVRVGRATPMSHCQIEAILPHRYPLLLVDQISSVDGWERITGTKAVTATESCYGVVPDGASLEAYAYPRSLIMESFGQVGGVLVNEKRKADALPADTVMLAGGVSSFKFLQDVYPGDTMEHRLVLEKELPDFAVLSGETFVAGRRVAEVTSMIVAYRPASAIRVSVSS